MLSVQVYMIMKEMVTLYTHYNMFGDSAKYTSIQDIAYCYKQSGKVGNFLVIKFIKGMQQVFMWSCMIEGTVFR